MGLDDSCNHDDPCVEGKMLALFTALVSLARTLSASGQLNRELFHDELSQCLNWLRNHNQAHAAQAFEELLPMLRDL